LIGCNMFMFGRANFSNHQADYPTEINMIWFDFCRLPTWYQLLCQESGEIPRIKTLKLKQKLWRATVVIATINVSLLIQGLSMSGTTIFLNFFFFLSILQ
jgi:hypothetical protein